MSWHQASALPRHTDEAEATFAWLSHQVIRLKTGTKLDPRKKVVQGSGSAPLIGTAIWLLHPGIFEVEKRLHLGPRPAGEFH